MEDLAIRIASFVAVGLASGFLSGLFGVGGGIIRIPIFLHLLPLFGVVHSVVMHVSIGTSIALVVPSAVAATRKQLALGNLDLKFFWTWAVGVLVGALIGNVVLPHASTEILTGIFALYLIAVGIHEAFLKRATSAATPPRGVIKLAVAAAIGGVAALTGTAGGTVTTPALQAFGVSIAAAIATSSATGLVTGTVGTVGALLAGWHAPDLPRYCIGYVDIVIFVAMVPAVMIAAPLGVQTGRSLSEAWLRRAFSILVFIIAADLIVKLAAGIW
jgi:uncharacterized membrane protein YfcA